MPDIVTAERMLLAALNILQRGLPPGDLNQRQVIAELWGVFDTPSAVEAIKKARASTRLTIRSQPDSASNSGLTNGLPSAPTKL